jgi:hypothetical protein
LGGRRGENLREQLPNLASGAAAMVERYEENARNPNLGKQQGLMEAIAINEYEDTAQKILKAVPGDADAFAALEHVAALRKRIANAR